MTKWMSDKIRDLIAQDERQSQAEGLRLHKAEIVKQQAPRLFEALRNFVLEDIKKYNSAFSEWLAVS